MLHGEKYGEQINMVILNYSNPFISVSNNTGITFKTEGLSIFDQENTKANARSIGNPVVP